MVLTVDLMMSAWLDILSDQNQKCSYKQQIWSENVQCPTIIVYIAINYVLI